MSPFTGKIQGISGILISTRQSAAGNYAKIPWLRDNFPTLKNREIKTSDQGSNRDCAGKDQGTCRSDPAA
jgi:hypothetical protein